MSETKEEPFQEVTDQLGYDLDHPEDSVEQVMVYLDSPDRHCHVWEESIPEESRELEEGEQYLILRKNPKDQAFPLIERSFHVACWNEYTT